jgi:type I restriction-modification system DNA methylase subunit
MIDALKLYDLFRTRFNLTEENAKEAAQTFDGFQTEINIGELATKTDLKNEITELRKELKDDLKSFKQDIRWTLGIVIGLLITLVIKSFFP